jgi:predicted RNA binding protein YcfA (HicA-like mRNA interferase family)
MILSGPISARKLLKFLRGKGFLDVHQRGSHVILRHPLTRRRISIPFHGSKDIPKPLAQKILREAGLNQ